MNRIKMLVGNQEIQFELGGAYVLNEDIFLALFDEKGDLYSYKVLGNGIIRSADMDEHVYSLFRTQALEMALKQKPPTPIQLHIHVDKIPKQMEGAVPDNILELLGGCNGTD